MVCVCERGREKAKEEKKKKESNLGVPGHFLRGGGSGYHDSLLTGVKTIHVGVLLKTAPLRLLFVLQNELQCVAVCCRMSCSVLQCVAE